MRKKPHKAILLSGPSGSGKTTIAKHLLKNNSKNMGFAVSACTRPKRPHETHGKEYYFLSTQEFRQKIAQNEFIEWEEVYAKSYYGTLKTEIANIWAANQTALLDIDVKGGLKIKSLFKENVLTIYIQVPSLQLLEERLRKRATDPEESITLRMRKINEEARLAHKFDVILMNGDLQKSLAEAQALLDEFLAR